MIIVSASILKGGLHRQLFNTANALGVIKDGWNGFNVVHSAAGRVGAIMAGFLPYNGAWGEHAQNSAGCAGWRA